LEAILLTAAFAVFIALTYVAWRRYLWASETLPEADTSPYSLADVFGERYLVNAPHQKGIQWLTDVFSRSARKFPNFPALQIPHTGDCLTFAELDTRAEKIAAAISPFLTGPDQVVAVAMSQDNWQIVASHLGVLKAGGTLMFLDTTLPHAVITHMLNDAQPVVILTRGQDKFGDLPTIDVLTLPETMLRREPPNWLDDPAQRLATIFYTSGTTGMPKGVECPHAGYVNLALSYADYFDLLPGMDATSLTSSLGYDGSISEMYSAWVSGCAVVLLTKEQIRSGPDLVPVLREAEVTVLFCPPVLLSTLTPTPEVDLPYPLCRYIVPAGEAFPAALVEPWTRGRRQIINTYGPTECSTDTSRQSLRPGEPITIGSPFPNVTYVILEIGSLNPLPHGEIGELCIGGIHVARGYRNLPEQTIQKFITHPRFGRLYRTGDRCKIDIEKQRVHFLGRIDAQLKVRGHRVEAQAVEDILQTQFVEIEAAVLDYQNEALVAFVTAPSVCREEISVVAPAPVEWAAHVTATLAKQLPEPSVPTRIFVVEKFALKPVSGKIDRGSLPNLSQILKNGGPEPAVRNTPNNGTLKAKPLVADASMDAQYDEVLAICRAVFERPLGLDDGFVEAGGHSITIAQLAQRLQAAGWMVSVRGLLSDCNTARLVADRMRVDQQAPKISPASPISAEKRVERDEAAAEVLSVGYFTTLQILFVILLYSPGLVAVLTVLGFADVERFFVAPYFWELMTLSVLGYLFALVTPFLGLLWVMMIKSFIGGDSYKNNVTPGVYPKWSRMHLRIWCIGRLENMAVVLMATMYRSAPLTTFVLRQLGAKVGDNFQCGPNVNLSGPFDLFTIDDDVAIQTGAYIHATKWSGQNLHVGPVRLESGCKIGMQAAITCNVSVGRGTWITPFTPILSDVGSHQMWEGSPARLAGRFIELKRTANICQYAYPIWMLETINVLMQVFLFLVLNVVPTTSIFLFVRGFTFAGQTELSDAYFNATPLLEVVWRLALDAFVTTWVAIVVISLLQCLFIRFTAASPGIYPSHGLKGALLIYRMNMMNSIQRLWGWTITGQYMRALAGMKFSRVGASECDLMFNLIPEVATADAGVFWSNGCFTNVLDCSAKHFQLRQLVMPRNFFSGNNSVAEHGHLPTNFLLGVSTPVSDIQFRQQMRSRLGEPLTVAGNPPVKFASASFHSGNETNMRPGFPIFLTRVLLNDLFSLGTLPIAEGLIVLVLYVCLLRLNGHPIINAVIAAVLTEVGLVLLCVAIKKVLIGKEWGADHATQFWSWRHFAYFFAQDCYFVWCRNAMGLLTGTILANSILRWMGCQIGRRTIVVAPLQCFDWNAVNFGNDCVIDGHPQFHTFETMMLKVKRTQIKDGCAIGVGSTVMGGAVIEPDTTILPLSLVLKEMNLTPATYGGSPAEIVSDTNLSAAIPDATRSTTKPLVVDNTDWLKAAAIILVLVDHFGYFFMENDEWWAVLGRFAAPIFFFLVGYSKTRSIPLHWIGLGVMLTLLDSSNADWEWVAPNILLSFVLIRFAYRYVSKLVERHPWISVALLVSVFIASLPIAAQLFDYGAEGWLWALFGLLHRQYVDSKAAAKVDSVPQTKKQTFRLLRLLACAAAAVVYVWQEQLEFDFPQVQLIVFILGVLVMSVSLSLFLRGRSRFQPPEKIAVALRFIGRHTLEIYAIQLAASEIIVWFVPSLAP